MAGASHNERLATPRAIDIGDAKKLNFYLDVIQGTFRGMQDQGVQPDFVLAYIGPSVKYLSSSPSAEVEREARRLTGLARTTDPDVEVVGPAPAPLGRLRGRYRFQFMVRSLRRPPLHRALLAVARAPSIKRVRVSIDVDPMSML